MGAQFRLNIDKANLDAPQPIPPPHDGILIYARNDDGAKRLNEALKGCFEISGYTSKLLPGFDQAASLIPGKQFIWADLGNDPILRPQACRD